MTTPLSIKDRICSVYKSSKKEEMYLYVSKHEGLKRVPEALLKMFGTPIPVMDFLIKEGKKLARVDSEQVVQDIKAKGFFLQMPPQDDNEPDKE